MLLGTTAASVAFTLSGQNYVKTFALSTIPALVGLALLVWAFGGERGRAAQESHIIGGWEHGAWAAGGGCSEAGTGSGEAV